MMRYSGTPVCRGIGLGQAVIYQKAGGKIVRRKVKDTKKEIERVTHAVSLSLSQLYELAKKAEQETGKTGAAIFTAYGMILEDNEYQNSIRTMISTESINAEFAVSFVSEKFAGIFSEMKDEYMRTKAADIRAISERLIRNLGNVSETTYDLEKPSIVVAEELPPGELMHMDRKKIRALVIVHGLATSHTAILARMMNIPTLICPKLAQSEINSETQLIVDAIRGEVILEPDIKVREEISGLIRQEQKKTEALKEQKGRESITESGRKITICANIGSLEEIEDAMEQDAEGIGLFRSECLYLGRELPPTEEEQVEIYSGLLLRMGEKPVVIRTLDLGSDKQMPYLLQENEPNPALGCRGIRLCLTQPVLFKTQLRALFRAAVYGNLSIMYPMLTSVEEMEAIQEIVETVEKELQIQKIPYCRPQQGIMIETPAAVMISAELAQYADFFSIGTNDLTQYTLAVDRQNEQLERFYRPHHPAVLRMIEMAVKNAHLYGRKTSICGELATDLELSEQFVNMGIDSLSVVPSMILPLRERIRRIK